MEMMRLLYTVYSNICQSEVKKKLLNWTDNETKALICVDEEKSAVCLKFISDDWQHRVNRYFGADDYEWDLNCKKAECCCLREQ